MEPVYAFLRFMYIVQSTAAARIQAVQLEKDDAERRLALLATEMVSYVAVVNVAVVFANKIHTMSR